MRRTPHCRRLPWVVLGLAVLPLTAVACSSTPSASSGTSGSSTTVHSSTTTLKPTSDTGGTRPVGPTPPASQTACALMSAANVNSIMGTNVRAPSAVVRGSVTTCTYRGPTLSKSVIIEYDTAATAATYAAGRTDIEQHGGKTTAIGGPDLGTEAYSFTLNSSGAPVNTVVTFQGTLQTIVSSTASANSVLRMSEAILHQLNANNGGTTTSPPAG